MPIRGSRPIPIRQYVGVPEPILEIEGDPRATIQIGEVAGLTDLSIRTIRHWEEMGLIRPSARSRGGFRLYTDEDVARIRLLRFMKPLNFTLEQMRDLLELRDSVASQTANNDDRMLALVWPRSSTAPDAATASKLVRDLRHYADQAQRRLETLRQQVLEVEEFVARLRREADDGEQQEGPTAR